MYLRLATHWSERVLCILTENRESWEPKIGKVIRNKIYCLILVCLPAFGSFTRTSAQDQPFFSQHLRNRMVYNPAFAGDREIPGFSLFSRQQWLGWDGSPTSNSLIAHTRLNNKNVGLGIALSFDKMGPVQHTGISGAYSYTLQINETGKVIMGLQGELSLQQIRISQLQLVDQGDQLFSEDPGIKLQPNIGLGVIYEHGNYSVYISVPTFLNSDLTPFEGDASRWSRTRRLVYLGAASNYSINDNLEMEPSVLFGFFREAILHLLNWQAC